MEMVALPAVSLEYKKREIFVLAKLPSTSQLVLSHKKFYYHTTTTEMCTSNPIALSTGPAWIANLGKHLRSSDYSQVS